MEQNDENYELIKSSLVKIQKLKKKLALQTEPIAIIGMSCRFPGGSNDPFSFWKLLSEGRDGIVEIPKERWDADTYYDPIPNTPGKMVNKLGGFLDVDISLFDADFFNISPREAEYLDPQHRLLIEVSHEAIQSAGIPHDSLKGSLTGVFCGTCTRDYWDLISAAGNKEILNLYMTTGNFPSTASGRISYIFGLNGPCCSIDTACSTSLVAIDQACQSLHNGDSNLALAGGVNLILSPDITIEFSQGNTLAPDGRCKTFDASANGYVRGEGCGVIVLKRLSDAKRDGDNILAVIKSSGINQDGASSGLTVPSGKSQEELLKKALKKSGLKGSDIDYIEAHGTGTPLGDPIEIRAIGAAYGERDAKNPLILGTVKTNIGHLEGASGVAGVIKAILALQNELIPANLHFKKLNPNIEMNFPGEICVENRSWKRGDTIRRAAVSAFGFSGTNAHIILEEGDRVEPQAFERVTTPTISYNRKRYWVEGIGNRISDQHAPEKIKEIKLLNSSELKNKKAIRDFVHDQLFNVMKFDSDTEISDNDNFFELGMDSILALEILNQIQTGIGKEIQLQKSLVLQFPTISQLSSTIFDLTSQEKSSEQRKLSSDKWILDLPGSKSPRIQLVCFAHTGGGPSLLKRWRELLPEDVHLSLIQLPGRESRVNEKILNYCPLVIAGIINSLKSRLDTPYILFGHSLGALLAAQTAAALQSMSLPAPQALIASCASPINKTEEIEALLKLEDEAFMKEFQQQFQGVPKSILEHSDLINFYASIFREDLKLILSSNLNLKLECPIFALYGIKDSIKQSEVDSWKNLTNAECEVIAIPGGHFAIVDKTDEYIKIIKNILNKGENYGR